MHTAFYSKVLKVAEEIHHACATAVGGSAGNCKDATLALAPALESVNEPVAICQEYVVVDGTKRDHYWCRIGNTIADQFRSERGPLIAAETSLPHYCEASFFVFTPTAVSRLLRAMDTYNSFEPKPRREKGLRKFGQCAKW